MKKNFKKFLALVLTGITIFTTANLYGLAAVPDGMGTEIVSETNCTSYEDCRGKFIQSEAEKRALKLYPWSRVGNWLGEWDKEWDIEKKLTELIKSDDKVDNTANCQVKCNTL